MSEIITYLSGEIPGGIVLLLLFLLAVNLTFIFLKSSGIISAQSAKKNHVTYSLAVFVIYAALWFALKPPLPRIRVVVLPAVSENSVLINDAATFEFSEYFQRMAQNSLDKKYLLHRWEWLAETIGRDSMFEIESWKSIAAKLGAGIIIEGRREGKTFSCAINSIEIQKTIKSDYPVSFRNIIKSLDETVDLFNQIPTEEPDINRDYLQAKIAFLNKDYAKAARLVKSNQDIDSQELLADIYVARGLAKQIDRQKAQYVKITIKEFSEAKNILKRLILERKDTPRAAYLLGRIALREEKYTDAEVYLKKALIDDLQNSRIYYALSFLMPDRLIDLGYSGRADVLQKAVELDPGYRDAVYELANEFYLTGTGTRSGMGTTSAMRTMEDFLGIKSGDPQILSLLASLYLKTQRLDEALSVFEELLIRFPNDSNLLYDLGIVYFNKQEYQKALGYFSKSIEISDNPDAYLFAAVTYRQMGKREKALEYYRERVRRKTGDDDKYAKEAMKGIRSILAEIETEKTE